MEDDWKPLMRNGRSSAGPILGFSFYARVVAESDKRDGVRRTPAVTAAPFRVSPGRSESGIEESTISESGILAVDLETDRV
jgi:hypothetical protein